MNRERERGLHTSFNGIPLLDALECSKKIGRLQFKNVKRDNKRPHFFLQSLGVTTL